MIILLTTTNKTMSDELGKAAAKGAFAAGKKACCGVDWKNPIIWGIIACVAGSIRLCLFTYLPSACFCFVYFFYKVIFLWHSNALLVLNLCIFLFPFYLNLTFAWQWSFFVLVVRFPIQWGLMGKAPTLALVLDSLFGFCESNLSMLELMIIICDLD